MTPMERNKLKEGTMENGMGKCPHGEFVLTKGCPECITERRAADATKVQPIIVKVQYITEINGEATGREYSYLSFDRLKVGNVVQVPVGRDMALKGLVTAVDVPEAEIEEFRDKIKTIPAGSIYPAFEAPASGGEHGENLLPNDDEEVAFSFGIEPIIEAPETAVIWIAPGQDQAVIALLDEVMRIKEWADKRVVATREDDKDATNDLTLMSKLKVAIEGKRQEWRGPIKEQLDTVDTAFKLLTEPLAQANKIIRDKVTAYRLELARVQQEQEEINRKRREAAEAEMRLKGELTEGVNEVEVEEAPKLTRAALGTSGMVANWKFEVTDFAQLPDEYKVADAAMLNAIARKHHDQKPVPGVRFYSEKTLRISPRTP